MFHFAWQYTLQALGFRSKYEQGNALGFSMHLDPAQPMCFALLLIQEGRVRESQTHTSPQQHLL